MLPAMVNLSKQDTTRHQWTNVWGYVYRFYFSWSDEL